MRKKIFTLMAVMLSVAILANDIPYVYNVENTGANCPLPALLTVNELPSIVRLPNPFEWSDGSGTIGAFDDWKCRRAEIKAEIEQYEIGAKPNRPENISATYADETLTVVVTENGKTLTLTSTVVMPTGTGPFPIIIGMNSPTGSLSSSLFTGCIQIPFRHDQVATYSQNGSKNLNAPFYQMYPELSQAGDYCAWAWGVSRLIDGIEIVKNEMNADLEHIGVTGCSYAGKMALFAGAFDERIALTIAQESGGGGTASWRVSETLGEVEKISNTNYSWFMPALKTNFDGKVEKLPYDHHELLAMIAPRALLTLGNDGWVWLANESGYVASMAALEVWKFMGVEDRFGFDFTGGHNHCSAAESQNTAVANFVDKFLRGNNNVNTSILTHPYQNINYQFWISDWTDVQEPDVKREQYWHEAESAECVTIGGNMIVVDDVNASNGKYVTAKEGLNSLESAPGEEGLMTVPLIVDNPRNFSIYFRLNCPNDNEDSFWVQIDNGPFIAYDGLATNGEWKWVRIATPALLAGSHTIRIGYRENGAKLDKVCITNAPDEIPEGLGGEETGCIAVPACSILDFESGNIAGWAKQNPGAGIDITQEDAHSGKYALKMVNGSGTDPWSVQAFSTEVEIVPGHTYNVSFWIRAVDGGGKGRISTTASGQLGNQYWADFNVGDTWQQITYTNLTAAGTSVRLAFDMGYVAQKTYYIDDIVFEDITADPEPVLKVAGTVWNAGEVVVGESLQSDVFSVRNIGTGTLTITGTSELAAPWSATFEAQSGISLKAGQVQEFTFTYAPTSIGLSAIHFTINTNAGDAIIELNGTGKSGTGILGIENTGIKIFSPAQGKISIATPESSKVRISNLIGKEIGTYTVDSLLELSLPAGIYIICVENENITHTQKVVVR